MTRRETRLSTGRTNRSRSAMGVLNEDGDGRGSPVLSASVDMLRVHTEAPSDTRLSISGAKRDFDPVKGDALDQLLSSSQRRARDEKPAATGFSVSLTSSHSRFQEEEDSTGSQSANTYKARSASDMRAKFLASPISPESANKIRLDRVRGSYSDELKQLQIKLMSNEARPFSALQKALVFDSADSNAALSLEAKNEKLKKAIAVATGHTMVPSEMLIQELRSLTCTQPNHQVNYGELMQVVWDEKVLERNKPNIKPGRGDQNSTLKYLFLVGNAAGCYNDYILPEPSVWGVKKVSSSVRYSLFTNESVDMSTTFKCVSPSMLKEVDAGLKMSAAQHPVTGRPLDPWLSYCAVSHGKKCDNRPPDQPMDILKLTQRKGQSREWDCLPNFSFGFTRLHKGEWNKAERRNLVI